MALPARTVLLSFCAVAVLGGCANVQLDPFGRPYSGDNTIPPGNVLQCGDPSVDLQPRMVRGNLPPMPVENGFTVKNAEAVVVYRVSAAGAVEVVSVESSDKAYRNHALIAVRDWKMTPARRDGVAVAATCTVTLSTTFRGYEDAPPGQVNR